MQKFVFNAVVKATDESGSKRKALEEDEREETKVSVAKGDDDDSKRRKLQTCYKCGGIIFIAVKLLASYLSMFISRANLNEALEIYLV